MLILKASALQMRMDRLLYFSLISLKHTKNTVPLEEGRELFLRKKFGGSSKIYRRAKKHAMRRELLRLQKEEYITNAF